MAGWAEAKADAVRVAEAYIAERWDEIRRRFDDDLLIALTEEQLADGWHGLMTAYGRPAVSGSALAARAGAYTVVDVPLTFRRGLFRSRHKVRVTYNDSGRVAGLFVLRRSA